jgi:hypothetical protein
MDGSSQGSTRQLPSLTETSFEKERIMIGKRFLAAGAMALAFAASGPPAEAAPHYPWHSSYRAVIDQTAAVVQGTVVRVAETYNEEEGPRTLVTLSPVKALWGDFRGTSVTLKLFGGPVPGRRGRVDEVHVPTFVQGKTYLVFLSNRDWRLSPVTARQSYLVERIHDRDVVVTTDGYAVSGINDVTGPARKFPVYRIPREIPDNFVPAVARDVTPAQVAEASSPARLVADLKAWGRRNGVSVHGTFTDRPYRTANWRIETTTPDRTAEKAAAAQEPVFAPQAGRPSAPEREQKTCGDRSTAVDADPRDRSMSCTDDEGGAQ